ncbi:MAG: TonB-dependent receptor [Flavobacteriales bacterium]
MRIIHGIFLCVAMLTSVAYGNAQNCEVSGKIYDALNDQGLPMANVFYGTGQGISADLDGNYTFSLPYGTYRVEFSFVGYATQVVNLKLEKETKRLDVGMYSTELEEAVVEADIAIDRETPVAFSNIDIRTINEELASQDIPMLLNTTPGVYATQQGGGDGDARITIRGFDQRNIAVMLDGIPVNDMENGWVYWSNWFGLDAIMQTTQVQRGLGISKLAVPSVGGTINIITKGIEQKKATQIKQEVANAGFLRTTFGHTSGRLKGGWGFTVAGSYKQGNGWVDGNFTEGFFYYGKVQKALGNHVLTLSGFGAPQSHGQRTVRAGVSSFDAQTAENNGIALTTNQFGIGHNFSVGELTRYDLDANGNKINEETESLNDRKNYYHKPQFSFRHSWKINDKLSLANNVYLSIGNGGGTRLDRSFSNDELIANGGPDYQSIYDIQTGYAFEPTPFVSEDPTIIPGISTTEHAATQNFINASVNNHFWYGLLSTFTYKQSDQVTFSGGIDARSYKGEHYRIVYDLLGADYLFDTNNPNSSTGVKREGDIIDYHNDAFVEWGGLFGQVEYKNELWSGFLSGSYAMTRYKRKDYIIPKTTVVDGETISPIYFWGDDATTPEAVEVIAPNGQVFTPASPELEYQTTDWYYKGGYTVKAGFNRKLNEKHNAYVNLGYLDRAPRFQNVFDFGNKLFNDIQNELIQAFEVGYGFKTRPLNVNLNAYYTTWQNRPVNRGVSIVDPLDPEEFISANINGMNARHMGAELEAAYALTKKLTLEGIVSLGDWIWDSKDTVRFFYDNGAPVLENGQQVSQAYDAQGVHVGDAAQTQLGGMIRYEFKRGTYVKLRYTYFDRHFANFDPISLNGADAGRDSWQLPSYGMLDFHLGYQVKLRGTNRINLRGSVFNILNVKAISDGTMNDDRAVGLDSEQGAFAPENTAVFFLQGTRFNVSATLNF